MQNIFEKKAFLSFTCCGKCEISVLYVYILIVAFKILFALLNEPHKYFHFSFYISLTFINV